MTAGRRAMGTTRNNTDDSRLVAELKAARRIMVFTGAGVSTASGIPDFRGPHGVWTRRRPVYYDEFLTSEAARVDYWNYKLESWEIYSHALPNPVHHAIVALEGAGKINSVVTQNVDGLHRRAGTSLGVRSRDGPAAPAPSRAGLKAHGRHPSIPIPLVIPAYF